jgi:hypothetical protein
VIYRDLSNGQVLSFTCSKLINLNPADLIVIFFITSVHVELALDQSGWLQSQNMNRPNFSAGLATCPTSILHTFHMNVVFSSCWAVKDLFWNTYSFRAGVGIGTLIQMCTKFVSVIFVKPDVFLKILGPTSTWTRHGSVTIRRQGCFPPVHLAGLMSWLVDTFHFGWHHGRSAVDTKYNHWL